MDKKTFTRAFNPATKYIPVSNLRKSRDWPLALDIGYSGVKGMSPNASYCFPAFARETDSSIIGNPSASDITYSDETGRQWFVGALAQSQLRANDTTDSSSTLYERNRYFSPMFLVLARVGMALGLKSNDHGMPDSSNIYFQTGLPPAYLAGDSPLLMDALEGRHVFSIKCGKGDWQEYDITLNRNNMHILEQPMGAVFSASKLDDGSTVPGPGGRPIVNERILVLDGGFGTLDTISIFNRYLENNMNSFSGLGMKGVLGMFRDSLLNQHGIEVSVHAMQQALSDGYIVKTNKREHTQEKMPIFDLLSECNRAICLQAMDRIDAAYDFLSAHRFLLLAGGTCAAWKEIIEERYAGMTNLGIISADQNDNLGPVFSNVRGYYLYRALSLGKK